MEDLNASKTHLHNIRLRMDETVTTYDTLLTDKEDRLAQEKEEEDSKKKEDENIRTGRKKEKGKVKETRIMSKPSRTPSITTAPTAFLAPDNLETMLFGDEPEEGEILTPGCVSGFLKKRTKQIAEFSTDEETKSNREQKKQRQTKGGKDGLSYEVGDFKSRMEPEDYKSFRDVIENQSLGYEDKGLIMHHLIKEKGSTSSLHIDHMKTSEKDEFIAYTCFLTAGHYIRIKQTIPKNMKSYWTDTVVKRWKALGNTHVEKENTITINKYKSILKNINKRSLNG